LMVISGIGGGMAGRAINKKIDSDTVDKLFVGLMVALILINIYNIYRFMV
ncbi:MAG: sulfite exporter TauE/SafE family protein, partial [Oscillospiraceae bacterium]|nr:sulfite exporter TauE/SafE family protein [Oscillospiraceae bacterium]